MKFENPFKPGAGHQPPYLAGRDQEISEFSKLLDQQQILTNVILTGLRGVGKTVLLNHFKAKAIEKNWIWIGTDLSESASVSEDSMAVRLLTDLSPITSLITIKREAKKSIGFIPEEVYQEEKLTFDRLYSIYKSVPGLVSDKLKAVLELVWECIKGSQYKGIIFAYDEAQTISDQPGKDQYPVALLLDVFQSIQRKNIPFMLVLVGLPTLFPKLVDSRTFAERMFRSIFLKKLNKEASREAIIKPMAKTPVKFTDDSIETVIRESGGYPYFIQFICKEVYDVFIQQIEQQSKPSVPIEAINVKLDNDFFAGRWARITDRQRELLMVIARLENCQEEFTVQDVVEGSKKYLANPFGSSHVNQMLSSLNNAGLVYKNRDGKYSFAVPLLDKFILRQIRDKERMGN